MHISAIEPIGAQRVSPWPEFAQRLAKSMGITPPPPQADPVEGSTTLTPARLRIALLELGAPTTADNQSLAEAFARLGLALTTETLAAAHAAMAAAPESSPESYALAILWRLPPTPAILRAISAAAGSSETSPTNLLPAEVMSWLGFSADAHADPEELAAKLYLTVRDYGRSTESRLLSSNGEFPIISPQDARTALMRLALGSNDPRIQSAANAMAERIKGQQLLNQISLRENPLAAFYLAVPLQIKAETAIAELRLEQWDDEADSSLLPEETIWLAATLRVRLRRIGRVEATLRGTLAGRLECLLEAETSLGQRLLARRAPLLQQSLSQSEDWQVAEIEVRRKTEWEPLWHGGEKLRSPRACIDWRA